MRKIVKKIAAIGVGIAMLGATLTSAVALDLADYPSPFLVGGKFDTSSVIVVGEDAKPSDIAAGSGIIAIDWQQNSYAASGVGGTTVSVSDGDYAKVPVSDGTISTQVADSSYIDSEIDDSDMSSLADSSVNFISKDYDFREIVYISQLSPSIETSLTSSDDDYETDVVMEIRKQSLGYFIVFDEAIDKYLTNASTTDSMKLDFLGKRLKITGATATSITAQVGEEHYMKVGDTVEVDGKKVTLNNVGSGGAVNIDVDGVIETISASSTETVNGIEVNVDETFYDSNDVSQRSATLIIGEDAVQTYKTGDAYIGENEDNPDWVWKIQSLDDGSAATNIVSNETGIVANAGPILGVWNDFVVNSDDDAMIVGTKEGWASCYSYPNDYVQLCLDSISLGEDDYMTVKFSVVDDLSIAETADQNAVLIDANKPEGLSIDTSSLTVTTLSADKKTDKIWLTDNTNEELKVYYWDTTTTNETYAGTLNLTGLALDEGSEDGIFGYINWGDTKSDSASDGAQGILLRAYNTSGTASVSIVLDVGRDDSNGPDRISGYSQDAINITFSDGYGADFTALGATADKEEAMELSWNQTTIGTKDEDHRTIYGIIIRDPKSHGASDEVVLDIPNDQLYANIIIKGSKTITSISGDRASVALGVNPVAVSDEISDISAHNVLLVGGPCVNPAIGKVAGLGMAVCEDWTLQPGEALVKLAANGEKVAMLVAGTTAADTTLAAQVVADSENQANLKGTEVVVKGTSLSTATLTASA